MRVGTIGDIGANLAKFNTIDRQVPIRVQLPERLRGDLSQIETLKVPVKGGAAVPLSTVADLSLGRGPTAIDRYDRSIRVALEADMEGSDALGALIGAVLALPTAKDLPPGVTIRQTGDAEVMGEVFEGFALAMGAGLMMVFGVLVLLFGNFLQPLTILFSLPLSIGGAILGLLIFNKPISMPVVIGILMLMGVVTKNAIMLVTSPWKRWPAAWTAPPRSSMPPQARPADRDDHHRHGGRHGALGHGARHRRRVPRAHGHRGHRRPDRLHGPVAGLRAGDLRPRR